VYDGLSRTFQLQEVKIDQKRYWRKFIKDKRDIMRGFPINKVLPTIQVVWPLENDGPKILIHQDNSRHPILPNDQAFVQVVANIGLVIKLIQQPATSPDLNALDPGVIISKQSLTYTRIPKTLEDLIKGVHEEFDEYEVSKFNRIFLTLHACMIKVMNHGGENGYETPHVNKEKLVMLGPLLTNG
jgi:hypothetical protein